MTAEGSEFYANAVPSLIFMEWICPIGKPIPTLQRVGDIWQRKSNYFSTGNHHSCQAFPSGTDEIFRLN